MSPVTTDSSRNFSELASYSDTSLSALSTVFSLGDSDPRSPVGPGGENALRLQQSLEIVAKTWGVPTPTLSILADRYMAFYLAIMGSISSGQRTRLISYSPIEKKEILAIIDGLDPAINRFEFEIGLDGLIKDPGDEESLSIYQLRNGETGIDQIVVPAGSLIIDATSALPGDLHRLDLAHLPWRAIVLDATSWGGPRGVYYLAINPAFQWRNPFPTLENAMPTFGANYGLTLVATLALEEFLTWDLKAIASANMIIRDGVSASPNVDIAVDIAGALTRDRLSLSFLYIQSEELQRALWNEGFLVDSGSACSSSALEPSHVLTRMGLLSHGNVRVRLRPANVDNAGVLAETLVRLVSKLRG